VNHIPDGQNVTPSQPMGCHGKYKTQQKIVPNAFCAVAVLWSALYLGGRAIGQGVSCPSYRRGLGSISG
jgi:hypothetical protein